jgi:hypothetical protein
MGGSITRTDEEEDLRNFIRKECKPITPIHPEAENKIHLKFHVDSWKQIKKDVVPMMKTPYVIRIEPLATYGDYLVDT